MPLGRPQYFCPAVGCVGASEPFSQQTLIEHPIDRSHVALSCPFCKTLVFTCESCAALLEDSVDVNIVEDEVKVCRKCGFLNLIDEELRKSLKLPVTRPMTTESARIIQRTISEERYIAYKQNELEAIQAKLDRRGDGNIRLTKSEHTNRGIKRRRSDMEEKSAPAKRKKGEQEEDQTLLMYSDWKKHLKSPEMEAEIVSVIRDQLKSLHDPAMRQSDLQVAWKMMSKQSLPGTSELPDFAKLSNTTLDILRALYGPEGELNPEKRQKIMNILSEAEKWINEEKSDLETSRMRLDVASNLAEIPFSTSSTSSAKDDRPKVDVSALVGGVLKFRRNQFRYRFECRAEKYLQLLEAINIELQGLYKEVRQLFKEGNAGSHLTSSMIIDVLLDESGTEERTKPQHALQMQQNEKIERAKTKITLWRALYNAFSTSVT